MLPQWSKTVYASGRKHLTRPTLVPIYTFEYQLSPGDPIHHLAPTHRPQIVNARQA